jgi:hypothetical protein
MTEWLPPNCPIYTEYIVTGALQLFHTFIYFTLGLSNGDMCLLLSRPPSDDVAWVFSARSPSDEDHRGFIMGLCRHVHSGPLS